MKNLIYLFLLCSCLSFAQTMTVKVVGVTDGDTVNVLAPGNEMLKIRLAEIDAPEKSQDFGQAAKKHLSDLIYDKTVQLIIIDIDRYGRSIGKIYLDNVYVSYLMIKDGYAWHFKKYSDSEVLARAENEARKNKKGLWLVPGAVAPWEWRKTKK